MPARPDQGLSQGHKAPAWPARPGAPHHGARCLAWRPPAHLSKLTAPPEKAGRRGDLFGGFVPGERVCRPGDWTRRRPLPHGHVISGHVGAAPPLWAYLRRDFVCRPIESAVSSGPQKAPLLPKLQPPRFQSAHSRNVTALQDLGGGWGGSVFSPFGKTHKNRNLRP